MPPQVYRCVLCKASIALEDVNISTDIALCRSCGRTMPFSEVVTIPGANEVNFAHPPKGVRIEESPIHGRALIYRKFSPALLFLIPFTAFWSGLSMFGIYGTQIKERAFDLESSLFGLPFLLGTIVLLSIILFGLFGRWRISLSGGVLSVALELGLFAWTRRLVCDSSAMVGIKMAKLQSRNVPQRIIEVECLGHKLRFGLPLPEDAKAFVAEALHRMIQGG